MVKSGFGTLYRYATTNDIIIIGICSFCAVVAGAALPLMTVIFGQLAGQFQGYLVLGTVSHASFEHTMSHMILYFVYLAVAEFVRVPTNEFVPIAPSNRNRSLFTYPQLDSFVISYSLFYSFICI